MAASGTIRGGGTARERAGRFAGVLLALAVTIGLGSHPAPAQSTTKIIALGDSLTAGFGLSTAEAFPNQLAQALAARGHQVEIVNAGVSGDTAAAGLDRLAWAVPDDADAVIVELGANDALRGIDLARTRAALDSILTELSARKLPVLLAGMKAPRNWGDAYAAAFDPLYAELATKHGALLYPFFLDGVALDPALNQDDGIHPNGKGVAVIVARMLPAVEALIKPLAKP
jgi:acyl-CoA thioesterase I